MMQRVLYYSRIWQCHLALSFGSVLTKRFEMICYWFGKLARFLFFILLIASLFRHTRDFLGYSMEEMVLIFLTYNLIDVLSQVFFRGLYGLGREVNRGLFDFTLIRPAHPLFLVMTRIVDVTDLIFLIPIGIGFFFLLPLIDPSFNQSIIYLALLVTGMILATALHIIMAAIIVRMRDDSFLMFFRLMARFAMFPQETYHTFIRLLLIFVFPVFTMMVFPAQALFGKLGWVWVVAAPLIAGCFLWLSLKIWQRSIRLYSSASS